MEHILKKFEEFAAEPEILHLFRGMDDYNRHRVLQLMVREFPYADDAFDRALASAADALHPTNERAQDDLYPIGKMNMEASRLHRMELEKHVLAAERKAAGRSAMLTPLSDPQWHGSAFGG